MLNLGIYSTMETNPIKILIADDEPDIIEIISFHLTKAGFEVFTAKDEIGRAHV